MGLRTKKLGKQVRQSGKKEKDILARRQREQVLFKKRGRWGAWRGEVANIPLVRQREQKER